VTIYRNYAKETRIASTSVPEGNSEIVISNITTFMDENSIQVGCKNSVKILSVSSRNNFLSEDKSYQNKKINTWNDSIKLLDRKSRFIAKQKESFEIELNVLNQNNKLGSTTEGLKPSLLKELLELNRTKQIEIKKLIFDADEDYTELRNTIASLQQQINELNANMNQKQVKEIVLKVQSTSAINTQFKVSYLTTAASWTPTYELRCENTSAPLNLACRAKIIQKTGYDWQNVHIKLSTANPNQNHNRPILYPIFVDFMQPDYYKKVMRLESEKMNSYSNMAQEMKAPAPATVQMMGYADASKDEYFVDGLKLGKNDVTIAENNLMVEYELADNHDIESDGQEHIIGFQELKIPATYNYHAVPKLDFGVFLLARITDWGKYNLLAGDATIFFDDMYVGKSYINPNISADTMLISLGRDEKIQVKRIKLNEFCVTKKFSNKKKETLAYEIKLKNNKNIPVEIEVLDQYPISRNSDIEVELEESSGAEITKDLGKLLWRIKLNPSESKSMKLIYTIKFPEDKMIAEKN
ncbi:MAG: DUF4139 domain-containing protein, partial [Saprospiraceae bacterium]|nr:DUF4139 domain-containing protein [Saprospiraceae bacterium]